MKTFETFYKIAKLLAMILCICLFLLLMSEIWTKFLSKETTMSVLLEIENIEEKLPPCLTACPFKPYKKPGFNFRFMLNSLELGYKVTLRK